MRSSCPNDDPNFTKVLSRWVDPTPAARQNIYYMVCIPTRFVLYYLVYLYRENAGVQAVVALLSIMTMMHLYPDMETGRQWWSKRFDFGISALTVIACIGAYAGKTDPRFIPGLLYLSLAGGILQSLFVDFC